MIWLQKSHVLYKTLTLLLGCSKFSCLSYNSQDHWSSGDSAYSGLGSLHNHQSRKCPIALPIEDSSLTTLACIKLIFFEMPKQGLFHALTYISCYDYEYLIICLQIVSLVHENTQRDILFQYLNILPSHSCILLTVLCQLTLYVTL